MAKLPSLHFQFGTPNTALGPKTANQTLLVNDAAKIAAAYDKLFNLALKGHTSDAILLEQLNNASQHARQLTTTSQRAKRLR